MRLHVNIDHVATVRQARRTDEPDPARAAVLAELGGADGITVHLREDRRHIQDRDLRVLMDTVRTGINLELAAAPEMLAIAEQMRPMAVTLVPERREEITTEGGLELGGEGRKRVAAAVDRLRQAGLRVSLFIVPDLKDLDAASAIGANAVELHTGAYAGCWKGAQIRAGLSDQLGRLRRAAAHGRSLGLAVHAGHGLTYENVTPVAAIAEIEELNIGHSIVSRAVLVGIERAVSEMKAIVSRARDARAG
jgi:pyridoxine 5-phosphate synthase